MAYKIEIKPSTTQPEPGKRSDAQSAFITYPPPDEEEIPLGYPEVAAGNLGRERIFNHLLRLGLYGGGSFLVATDGGIRSLDGLLQGNIGQGLVGLTEFCAGSFCFSESMYSWADQRRKLRDIGPKLVGKIRSGFESAIQSREPSGRTINRS